MKIEKTWIGVFLNHLFNNYLPYWNGINTILMGYVGILFSINKSNYLWGIDSNKIGWVLLIICVISIISNICLQIHNSKTIDEILDEKKKEFLKLENQKNTSELKIQGLENKLARINSNSMEIVEIHLAYLAEKMNFTNNERITLYKFVKDNFFVLGRYSKNPELKKRSRTSYGKEGLIFKAWNESVYFINSGIPLPLNKKKKFNNAYYEFMNDTSRIDKDTIVNMRMKSRSFYIKSLKDLMNLEQTSIIVIESTEDKAFERAVIETAFDQDEEKRLVAFVEKIDWDFQKISNASKIGF